METDASRPLWNPDKILQISQHNFVNETCVGTTSYGARCRRNWAPYTHQRVQRILDELSFRRPHNVTIEMLEQLAQAALCGGHFSRYQEMGQKWARILGGIHNISVQSRTAVQVPALRKQLEEAESKAVSDTHEHQQELEEKDALIKQLEREKHNAWKIVGVSEPLAGGIRYEENDRLHWEIRIEMASENQNLREQLQSAKDQIKMLTAQLHGVHVAPQGYFDIEPLQSSDFQNDEAKNSATGDTT